MQIRNKIALITGGGSGLGFEYVRELLRHGAKVVAILDLKNFNSEAAVAKLENEFGEGRVYFLACDVTKADQMKACFKKVVETFNELDIVINNAGIFNEIQYELMINTNVTALVRGTLLALDYMGKHKGGKGGTIVNVSSIAGLTLGNKASIYCGTKHAVIGFTQSIKNYHENTGVRFLTICPGYTWTPLLKDISNKFLDIVDNESATREVLDNPNIQSPQHVAQALIQLIHQGRNGAIWLSMDNQPPKNITLLGYKETPVVST